MTWPPSNLSPCSPSTLPSQSAENDGCARTIPFNRSRKEPSSKLIRKANKQAKRQTAITDILANGILKKL